MKDIKPFLVQYSEKSVAVLGNSYNIKDKLKELNGRFNKNLVYDGIKFTGWIFGNKQKDNLEELVGPLKTGNIKELGIEGPAAPTEQDKKEINAIKEMSPFIEHYSDKSIALFGNTIALKDQLKELNGKFNGNLKYNGHTIPGWIFSVSKREELEALLEKCTESVTCSNKVQKVVVVEEEEEEKNHIVAATPIAEPEHEHEPEPESRKRKAEKELEKEALLA